MCAATYDDAPCELFDLIDDPVGDSQNLFDDEAHQPVVEQLTDEIDGYFKRYQDPIKSGLRVKDLPQHNMSEAWRQQRSAPS